MIRIKPYPNGILRDPWLVPTSGDDADAVALGERMIAALAGLRRGAVVVAEAAEALAGAGFERAVVIRRAVLDVLAGLARDGRARHHAARGAVRAHDGAGLA